MADYGTKPARGFWGWRKWRNGRRSRRPSSSSLFSIGVGDNGNRPASGLVGALRPGLDAGWDLERRELMATTALVDNSEAGFAAGGFVSSNAFGGYLGNIAATAPGTNRTGVWTLTGLDPGVYEVAATWVAPIGNSNGLTTPFAINNGTITQNASVNQKVAPIADIVTNATNFQRISNSIQVGVSGTLTVSITDTGANGFPIADAIFAQKLTPAAGIVQDNTDPAFAVTGTFVKIAPGSPPSSFGGNVGAAPPAVLPGNSNPGTGTWLFTGLTPGANYQIALTWPVASTNASNTPVVINGGGVPQTFTVNQKIAPAADVVVAPNFNFQVVTANFTVTGTTLSVQINNTNANGFVIADAVRIQQTASPAANIAVSEGVNPITSAVSTVAFGTTSAGVPVTKTITVANTGLSVLNLATVLVNSPAFTLTQPGKLTLNPGESTTFNVTLNALAAGAAAGIVTIPSNDPDTPAFTFNVTGTVNQPLFPSVIGQRALFGNQVTAVGANFTATWLNFKALRIQFNQNVIIDTADIQLKNAVTGLPANFQLSYNPVTFAADISFAALPIGRYQLIIDGDDATTDGNVGVTNTTGAFLNNGADFVFNFKVLPGDVDGNGFVNSLDLQVASAAILAQRNGTFNPFIPFADVDGNGIVDGQDQNGIRSRIGTRLI